MSQAFGNNECEKCGQRHPMSFDCEADMKRAHESMVAAIGKPRFEKDGWCYQDKPQEGDARKIVTLEQDGMIWVGIRAFHSIAGKWMNNNEPERAKVIAWRDLDEPARGCWVHGKLIIPSRA